MKRIYRDERQGRIAGICAGLGELLDIDPTIIRLALVFLCVVTAFVPLTVTYLVGWVLIPEKSDLPR